MLPRLVTAFAIAASLAAPAAAQEDAKIDKVRVYIGTYTGKTSKGIYPCALAQATGKLSTPELAGEANGASFVAIHPTGSYLYAVSEVGDVKGGKDGGVIAFKIDPSTGDLKRLNQQSSKGAGPCHITADKAG